MHPPDTISPAKNPEAIRPKIKEIRVELIGALTRSDARTQVKSVYICGTDLGTMTEIGNRIFFAFGTPLDTTTIIAEELAGRIGARMCSLPRLIMTLPAGFC